MNVLAKFQIWRLNILYQLSFWKCFAGLSTVQKKIVQLPPDCWGLGGHAWNV